MESSEKKSPVMPFILGLFIGVVGFYFVSETFYPCDDDEYATPPVVVDPCEDWDPSSLPNSIPVGSIDSSTILYVSADGTTEEKGGVFHKCVFQYLVDSCKGDFISYRFANLEGKAGLYLADQFEDTGLENLAFFTAGDAFCPMRCE